MSLKRIVLRDFVIVAELELELATGFSVLTGETGAGKSILIDALQLVTGGRADVGLIRQGATRTDVSAEFDSTLQLDPWLEEAGFVAGESLLLRRTVDAQGKSRAWINATPATATQLRAVGEQLIDIYGQHAWQSLTRPQAVRELLDAYARLDTGALSRHWQAWRHAQDALERGQRELDAALNERERLCWQIAELEKLAPGADEWRDLVAEHTRLSNAHGLLQAASAAVQALDHDDTGVLNGLATASQQLVPQVGAEPAFQALVDVIDNCAAQAQDALHDLRAYLRRTEPDPNRLAELDTRMSHWVALARRFRRAPPELPELLNSWRLALRELDAATDLDMLMQAQAAAQRAYLASAKSISAGRASAAPMLASTITRAMQGLGMQGGAFDVQLEPHATGGGPGGLEEPVFLVAGHAGSTPRPVGKVASGGELSRIALAIAVTTSQLGSAQTLIFDEVDAGVGGAVAQTVGRLMKQLGQDRQVLTVTHLPQVAACADHHLVVSKAHHNGLTLSEVRSVQGESRVTEVARMLGGEHQSDTTLAHAREMLQTMSAQQA